MALLRAGSLSSSLSDELDPEEEPLPNLELDDRFLLCLPLVFSPVTRPEMLCAMPMMMEELKLVKYE